MFVKFGSNVYRVNIHSQSKITDGTMTGFDMWGQVST